MSSHGAQAWSGRLYLSAGAFLYVGPGAATDRHAHHAVQLVWAREGSLSVTIDEGRVTGPALLIPSGVHHTLDASGEIALLLVEPHGARGRALDRYARSQPETTELGARLIQAGFPTSTTSIDEVAAWCDAVTHELGGVSGAPQPLSATCRRAVQFIETHLDHSNLAAAAASAGVSPSRLTHVFSEEVGIPFRRFVLWTRIKRAVEMVRDGADLTGAAAEAGFSDSAHLSRTFREMFGLSPSALLSKAEILGDIWNSRPDSS